MNRHFTDLAITGLLVFLLVCECASPIARLTPASGAQQVPGNKNQAISIIDSVEVIADGRWNGDPAILDYVTPLRITITNRGGKDILILFRNFYLISPQGKHYAAIPPYNIVGSIQAPVPAAGYAPIYNPDFLFYRFYIAPYFSPIYPGLPIWNYPGVSLSYDPFYDPYYYNNYYPYWPTVPLPTPFMLSQAIPEGVVQSGGSLSGYFYFQTVNPNVKQVTFQADLQDVNHNIFGTVSIPFKVSKGY